MGIRLKKDLKMGKLIDDKVLWEKRRDAANLVQAVSASRTQYQDAGAEMTTLKNKIKSDVQNETWIAADFTRMAELITLREQILTKRPVYKAALIALKSQVLDTDYEDEIQVEIDTL